MRVHERSLFSRTSHNFLCRDAACRVSETGQAPSLQLTFFPAVHDIRIGPLVISRLVSPRRLAPGGHRMTSARGFAFTAAVRMVHRVHRNAAVMRTLPHPARTPRLAPGD